MTEPVTGPAIFAEQVRHLYRLSRPAYVGTLVNAAIVTVVMWGVVPSGLLAAWLAVMTAVVGLRYALYLAYLQAPRPPAEARTWARRFVAGAGATGLIWGFLASALYPASSMLHQFFVIFVIGGMALSAMVILAPVRQAFLAYMLPLMALTTAAVLSQGGNLHLFMGVLLIVFAGVMLVASPVLSDMMRESVRVKFENSGLVERISQVNLDLSERAAAQQRADEELRQSERRYRYLFESNPVPMWIRDEGTMSIQAVNAAALQTYGYARDEFLRLKSTDLMVAEDVGPFLEEMRARDPQENHASERRHRRKDGSVMEVGIVTFPFEFDGRPSRLALVQDNTERNRAERLRNLETAVTVLLAEAESTDEVMPRVLETMCRGLDCVYGARWLLDSKERVLRRAETWCVAEAAVESFCSDSIGRLDLSRPGGLTRKVWATGAPVWLPDLLQTADLVRRDAAARAGLGSAFALPLLVGGEFYGVMEFFSHPVRPRDDRVLGVAQTVGSHIGQFIGRMEAEHSLQFFASHDPLTGLFNRGMFGQRLQQALAQAQRFERTLALLFIDLDGFKRINDTLGHSAGDMALVEIAGRLRTTLREGDVIARMGGDEFVVLIEEFGEATQVAEVAKKVLETVGKPFALHAQEYAVTASIGISTYPRDAVDSPTLLKNADIAMYRAKEGGKNNFRFFAPEMNTHLVERVSLEAGLKHALERDELRVFYQPRVNLRSGAITGVESLVRWQHPSQGMIGPQEFVPIAEDGGLMNAIGGWVLATACAQARAWEEQGLPPLKVAVNLSARQFSQENLIHVVREALHAAGLDPGRLELEITEGMVIRNPDRALKALAQLRDLGVRTTLDDFGTGYSSLGYLMRCPVDSVKLDRSFVLKLPGDAESASVARAVIAMAHSLKLHVTAEGVETREQWDLLRELDCDEMQGHYFSEPVAADVLSGLVQQALAGPGRRATVQPLRPRREEPDAE